MERCICHCKLATRPSWVRTIKHYDMTPGWENLFWPSQLRRRAGELLAVGKCDVSLKCFTWTQSMMLLEHSYRP